MQSNIENNLYALCSTGNFSEAYWALETAYAKGYLDTVQYVDTKQALREDFPEFREYSQEQ